MAHTVVTTTELTYAGRTIGTATVTVSRIGQDPPETDDLVGVQVELELPAASATALQTLHPELVFGARVQVFGSDLVAGWSNVAGKVARTSTYSGTVFTTLFATATVYANAELAKLTAALAARQVALNDAG
jgi:hypothetical protein